MLSTELFSFQVSDEQLQNSPSRADGIDEVSEAHLRLFGCELIQQAGILLRLPQVVMATGQVLFHRFYCKKSFKDYTPEVGCVPSRTRRNPGRCRRAGASRQPLPRAAECGVFLPLPGGQAGGADLAEGARDHPRDAQARQPA